MVYLGSRCIVNLNGTKLKTMTRPKSAKLLHVVNSFIQINKKHGVITVLNKIINDGMIFKLQIVAIQPSGGWTEDHITLLGVDMK